MFRNFRTAAAPAAPLIASLALVAGILSAQPAERRNRIDVQDYTIKADISPNTQTISAEATVRFVPVDDGITGAVFELNNALNVSRVVDSQGKPVQAQRSQVAIHLQPSRAELALRLRVALLGFLARPEGLRALRAARGPERRSREDGRFRGRDRRPQAPA